MLVKDSVCLVTGSAQGLGKAFVVRLLQAGARVCISDIREDRGQASLKELQEQFGEERVTFVACDVTNQEQFTRLFDECEKYFSVPCVDLLINNAGISTMMENFGWRKCMEVNIIGVMIGTEIALERMKEQPTKSYNGEQASRGTILNIASMAGIATGFNEELLSYFVSKHGVVTLTRTLNASFKESGVEVKALCPMWADTEIVSGVRDEQKATLNAMVAKHGGLMTVEYVAEAMNSLLTSCPRGSVMACMNNLPYFVIPDITERMIQVLVVAALTIRKVTGANVVQVGDFKMAFAVLFGLLMILAYIF